MRSKLLSQPGLLAYQGVRALVVVGMRMQTVAIAWHVYALTHRPFSLGIVGLAQFVPIAALALVAGHTADRYSRKRVAMAGQLVIGLCGAALALASQRPDLGTLPIYAILVALGAARVFTVPATQALPPALVPPELLAQTIALSSTANQIAAIVGPLLGGLLLGLVGATWVFALSATLMAAAAGVLWLRVHPREHVRRPSAGGGWSEVFEGVRYVRRSRIVLGIISLDLFAALLGGATALLPIFATDILSAGASGLGLLRAAPSVGAALAAAGMASRTLRRAGASMLVAVAVFGVATVGFAFSRSLALSLVALALAGAADMVSVVVRQTILQMATPDAMRGRVNAVAVIFIGASDELGELESGVTAAWWGAVAAVAVGGLGASVVAGLWAMLFPELRRADRPSDLMARAEGEKS